MCIDWVEMSVLFLVQIKKKEPASGHKFHQRPGHPALAAFLVDYGVKSEVGRASGQDGLGTRVEGGGGERQLWVNCLLPRTLPYQA